MRKGFALLLVLLIVSIMSGFAASAFKVAREQFFITSAHVQIMQAQNLARSGINLARAGLLLDTNDRDDLEEDWNQLSMLSQLSPIPLGQGYVAVKIEDEERRQNLNILKPEELKKFFESIGLKRIKKSELLGMDIVENNIAGELTDSYLDWIDYDDEIRPQGAEGDYYKRKYKRLPHNQPLATLSELLLIKGFTREMLFGQKENPRLMDLLTIYGPGKMNINTISEDTLISLVKTDRPYNAEAIAKMMINRRPFRSEDEFRASSSIYGLSAEFLSRFKVKSDYFRIQARGIVGENESIVEAVVKRNDKKCDILLVRFLGQNKDN